MLNIRLRSTSDDQPSWSIDSKSICQPSPANKMKCFFLDYVHFWWSARLVDGLEPHLPPFSSQKNEMLTLGLCSLRMISQAGLEPHLPPLSTHKNEILNLWLRPTSDDQPSWSIDSKSICQPSLAIKWNASFWIMFTSDDQPGWLMSNPICHPLQPEKWNAHFWLCSSSDDQLGWSMDINPICQASPANKMKCSFLDYVQLLMISWAGQWT